MLKEAVAQVPESKTPEEKESLEKKIRRKEEEILKTSVNRNTVAIFKYIPTETVTLYVASVAATPAFKSVFPNGVLKLSYETFFFIVFAILTPIFALFLFATKRRAAKLTPVFPPLNKLPWWIIIASTMGFVCWAIAIPDGPFVQAPNLEAKGAVAAFIALFISTGLSQAEKLFIPR
jgi:hypothetical protein